MAIDADTAFEPVHLLSQRLASRQLVFDPKKLPEAERGRYEAIEAELAALKTAGSLPPPPPTTLTIADVADELDIELQLRKKCPQDLRLPTRHCHLQLALC